MDTTLFMVEIWVNPLLRKVEQKHPFFYNFVRKKNQKYSLILYNLIKSYIKYKTNLHLFTFQTPIIYKTTLFFIFFIFFIFLCLLYILIFTFSCFFTSTNICIIIISKRNASCSRRVVCIN